MQTNEDQSEIDIRNKIMYEDLCCCHSSITTFIWHSYKNHLWMTWLINKKDLCRSIYFTCNHYTKELWILTDIVHKQYYFSKLLFLHCLLMYWTSTFDTLFMIIQSGVIWLYSGSQFQLSLVKVTCISTYETHHCMYSLSLTTLVSSYPVCPPLTAAYIWLYSTPQANKVFLCIPPDGREWRAIRFVAYVWLLPQLCGPLISGCDIRIICSYLFSFVLV